ncbi:hypothetical protein M569_12210, partial [Genlisea aurea]
SEMEKEQLVYDVKLSSVGPGKVSGFNTSVSPENADLAMKLHYVKGVYYFGREAFEGVTVQDIKDPTFVWLNKYPVHCGRFRRDHPSERPYIKCNDCGVRFVEATCGKTLQEWFEMEGDERLLSSGQILGPELKFSPLVYIQLTKFKCGSVAVGLSWAHVLGDLFSAVDFMNDWGRTVAGLQIGQPVDFINQSAKPKLSNASTSFKDPLSIKRVDPVGDNWIHSPNCRMRVVSFRIPPAQLSLLRAKLQVKATFESVAAVIWKCIARIRGREKEQRVVTVCKKNDDRDGDRRKRILNNTQIVSVARADFPVIDAECGELVSLLMEDLVDERVKIGEAVERSYGLADFVVYGANLSFVNLEDTNLYGFEYNGQKSIRASYHIDGVSENGAIVVHPESSSGGGGGGRTVVAILPENEAIELKLEMKKEGLLI